MDNTPNRNDEKLGHASENEELNEFDEAYEPEFWNEEEEEPSSEAPPPARRKWIRNTIVSLLAAALIGNVLAFWPQIYNMRTLPFLFKSQELSSQPEIQSYKEAIVLVSTDKGKGTGFHISGGYIVTNYHVIEDKAYALVKFPEVDQGYEAELVRAAPDLDVALLKVDPGSRELPAIEIERDRPWQAGDHVYVIGNPLYFTQIVTEGTILGKLPVQGRPRTAMALDAPVFQGNSGSPVINEDGKAIAIIYATADVPHQDKIVQAGLAVPFKDVDDLMPELLPRQDE
ncbi:S1C family serine protease [Cohnella boryungensis]|uniref:S1C family serine protease n=1 Tax=Cohnella boryungensis TaxID=768479 RepID=A0ABV8S9Y8_9BACL